MNLQLPVVHRTSSDKATNRLLTGTSCTSHHCRAHLIQAFSGVIIACTFNSISVGRLRSCTRGPQIQGVVIPVPIIRGEERCDWLYLSRSAAISVWWGSFVKALPFLFISVCLSVRGPPSAGVPKKDCEDKSKATNNCWQDCNDECIRNLAFSRRCPDLTQTSVYRCLDSVVAVLINNSVSSTFSSQTQEIPTLPLLTDQPSSTHFAISKPCISLLLFQRPDRNFHLSLYSN